MIIEKQQDKLNDPNLSVGQKRAILFEILDNEINNPDSANDKLIAPILKHYKVILAPSGVRKDYQRYRKGDRKQIIFDLNSGKGLNQTLGIKHYPLKPEQESLEKVPEELKEYSIGSKIKNKNKPWFIYCLDCNNDSWSHTPDNVECPHCKSHNTRYNNVHDLPCMIY